MLKNSLKKQIDFPLLKEGDIQKSIVDYLKFYGICVWRINTMGVFNNFSQTYRPGPSKGVSDLVGILPGGRFFAIEVKSLKGKLSPAQKAFMEDVTLSGGLAFVARSVEDVLRIFKENGVHLK